MGISKKRKIIIQSNDTRRSNKISIHVFMIQLIKWGHNPDTRKESRTISRCAVRS